MIKDYYRVLGLANNAEDVVIRAAFKLLAQKYHPDKWPEEKETANRMMKAINEAHDTLSDPICKAEYDRRKGSYELDSDFYHILGVLDNADIHMIHAAHKALSQKYRNLPNHDFRKNRLHEINEAYQVLADRTNRKIYDIKKKNVTFILRKEPIFGFSLWKVYLLYILGFYIIIGSIFAIAILIHHHTNSHQSHIIENTVNELRQLWFAV